MIEGLRILIVDNDQLISSNCSSMIQKLGHEILGFAAGGKEAVAKTVSLPPDLIIMNFKLDDMDGLEASSQILQQRSLPIIIMTALPEPDMIEKGQAIGVAGYISKPFSLKELDYGLRLAWYRFKQIEALKNEIGDLQQMLKARKLIEQAKGLLMDRQRISEAEAYKRMQTMSRSQSIPMIKLAEAIIMTDELAKKPATARRTELN